MGPKEQEFFVFCQAFLSNATKVIYANIVEKQFYSDYGQLTGPLGLPYELVKKKVADALINCNGSHLRYPYDHPPVIKAMNSALSWGKVGNSGYSLQIFFEKKFHDSNFSKCLYDHINPWVQQYEQSMTTGFFNTLGMVLLVLLVVAVLAKGCHLYHNRNNQQQQRGNVITNSDGNRTGSSVGDSYSSSIFSGGGDSVSTTPSYNSNSNSDNDDGKAENDRLLGFRARY